MNGRKRLAAFCLALMMGLPSAAFASPLPIVRRHGDRERKRVAITVDDVFNVPLLIDVLDLCDEYGVRVTIFPVGKRLLAEDRAVWLRAVAAGHEIGNHSYNHRMLSRLDATPIMEELTLMRDQLDAVLGFRYPMTVFRPPYGKIGANGGSMFCQRVEKLGYHYVILWDVSNVDPYGAFEDTRNGSILLYHTNPADVRCLEMLIPRLLKAGFELCTVSELLDLPSAETLRALQKDAAALLEAESRAPKYLAGEEINAGGGK